tara:strand:- start:314 stop:829 length:516 start_codon:yes stop_codon:yes gene_type:complete
MSVAQNSLPSNLPYLNIKIVDEDVHEELVAADKPGLMPTRGTPTAVGLDLYAAEDVTLEPMYASTCADAHRQMVSTGISVEFPDTHALFIHDRSGMSAKFGVHRVAGLIDSDYRGPVKVALVNLSNHTYEISKGDRIAQAVLAPVSLVTPKRVSELSDTSRGSGGFGSTGK